MIETLAYTLLNLHRGSNERCIEDYRKWALAQIKPVIGFDIAYWGTGSHTKGDLLFHTRASYGLTEEFDELWNRHKHLDETAPSIVNATGDVVVVRRDELCRMAIYDMVWRHVGVRHGMGISILDASTGLFEILCFLREDSSDSVSEDEQRLVRCLAPHLIEAWRIHRHGQHSQDKQVVVPRESALVDREGFLYSADEAFSVQLLDEWPTWHGPRLPEVLIDRLRVEERFRFTGERIVIDAKPASCAHLFELVSRPLSVFDLLTFREKEVARLFSSGMTYKEVAESLALSPATVRVHLASIYHKTGITNKAAMTTLITSVHIE